MSGDARKGALRSRIGRRMFSLFVSCALLPLGVLATISLTQVSTQLQDEAHRELRRATKATGMTLAEQLMIMEADLQRAIDVFRSGEEFSAPLRERILERFRWIHHWGDVGPEQSATPILGRAREGRAPELSGVERAHVFRGKTLIKPTTLDRTNSWFALVRAIDVEDPAAGMMAAEVGSRLWAAAGVKPASGELLVRDSSGNTLIDTSGHPPIAELRAAQASGSDARRFEWSRDGEHYIAGYWDLFMRPRFLADWTIVHSRPRAEVLGTLTSFQTLFLLTTVLSFLVVVGLSLFQIRRTITPITKLQRATQRVTEGDFSVQVDIRSKDEFAELGQSFNRMQEHLIENIRRREQTERDLVRARDAAIDAAETEVRFINNVSHELRTPLTSILSFIELLQDFDELTPENRNEFLGIIEVESKHLARLIENVLQLSNPQGDSGAVEFDAIDVVQTVIDAVAEVPTPERDRIEIEHGDAVPAITGNETQLRGLWQHLIGNALRYSDAETTIEIRTRENGDSVVVEVEDHGIGIDPEDQAAIFDPFYQLGDDILTQKNKGTGLGLALAKDIVERHEGRIEVESELGRGAVFRVAFPVRKEQVANG